MRPAMRGDTRVEHRRLELVHGLDLSIHVQIGESKTRWLSAWGTNCAPVASGKLICEE